MAAYSPTIAYLVTRNGAVIGDYRNLFSIAKEKHISIDDEGWISFMGEKVNPKYSLSFGELGWSKEEAIQDWISSYLIKNLPTGYKIYRYLT